MTNNQPTLFDLPRLRENGKANKLDLGDRAFHDWYRFVLAYPPHLVRNYMDSFGLTEKSILLDPFCGTGTTLVESKLLGIPSIGIEANRFAQFATCVKTNWDINPDILYQQAHEVAEIAFETLLKQGINDNFPFEGDYHSLSLRTLKEEENKLILTNSISPLPLHKTLILLDILQHLKTEETYNHMLLALANTLVTTASNLHFGPEVGVGKLKTDAPVITSWLSSIEKMASDLQRVSRSTRPNCFTYFGDARCIDELLPLNSVDAVITSPPYPNEKDYTRITRLESVILGFINDKTDLRLMKKGLICSNSRNVYKGDDDDKWIENFPEIHQIADEIENRRIELRKTSGFEKLYGKVTTLYFGGMARHLAMLRPVLRPNAQLAYVVGDQASYLRVMIHTGQLLVKIAQYLGYEFVRIDLFRTRLATVTKKQLREEVVILRWKG